MDEGGDKGVTNAKHANEGRRHLKIADKTIKIWMMFLLLSLITASRIECENSSVKSEADWLQPSS